MVKKLIKKLVDYEQWSQRCVHAEGILMELKYMTFLIKDDGLLEKYNKVWNTVSSSMKKVFDSEPWYNEKYLKNEIKFYKGKLSATFNSDKVPKEGCQCICLSVILINSVFRNVKKYFHICF